MDSIHLSKCDLPNQFESAGSHPIRQLEAFQQTEGLTVLVIFVVEIFICNGAIIADGVSEALKICYHFNMATIPLDKKHRVTAKSPGSTQD